MCITVIYGPRQMWPNLLDCDACTRKIKVHSQTIVTLQEEHVLILSKYTILLKSVTFDITVVWVLTYYKKCFCI